MPFQPIGLKRVQHRALSRLEERNWSQKSLFRKLSLEPLTKKASNLTLALFRPKAQRSRGPIVDLTGRATPPSLFQTWIQLLPRIKESAFSSCSTTPMKMCLKSIMHWEARSRSSTQIWRFESYAQDMAETLLYRTASIWARCMQIQSDWNSVSWTDFKHLRFSRRSLYRKEVPVRAVSFCRTMNSSSFHPQKFCFRVKLWLLALFLNSSFVNSLLEDRKCSVSTCSYFFHSS